MLIMRDLRTWSTRWRHLAFNADKAETTDMPASVTEAVDNSGNRAGVYCAWHCKKRKRVLRSARTAALRTGHDWTWISHKGELARRTVSLDRLRRYVEGGGREGMTRGACAFRATDDLWLPVEVVRLPKP